LNWKNRNDENIDINLNPNTKELMGYSKSGLSQTCKINSVDADGNALPGNICENGYTCTQDLFSGQNTKDKNIGICLSNLGSPCNTILDCASSSGANICLGGKCEIIGEALNQNCVNDTDCMLLTGLDSNEINTFFRNEFFYLCNNFGLCKINGSKDVKKSGYEYINTACFHDSDCYDNYTGDPKIGYNQSFCSISENSKKQDIIPSGVCKFYKQVGMELLNEDDKCMDDLIVENVNGKKICQFKDKIGDGIACNMKINENDCNSLPSINGIKSECLYSSNVYSRLSGSLESDANAIAGYVGKCGYAVNDIYNECDDRNNNCIKPYYCENLGTGNNYCRSSIFSLNCGIQSFCSSDMSCILDETSPKYGNCIWKEEENNFKPCSNSLNCTAACGNTNQELTFRKLIGNKFENLFNVSRDIVDTTISSNNILEDGNMNVYEDKDGNIYVTIVASVFGKSETDINSQTIEINIRHIIWNETTSSKKEYIFQLTCTQDGLNLYTTGGYSNDGVNFYSYREENLTLPSGTYGKFPHKIKKTYFDSVDIFFVIEPENMPYPLLFAIPISYFKTFDGKSLPSENSDATLNIPFANYINYLAFKFVGFSENITLHNSFFLWGIYSGYVSYNLNDIFLSFFDDNPLHLGFLSRKRQGVTIKSCYSYVTYQDNYNSSTKSPYFNTFLTATYQIIYQKGIPSFVDKTGLSLDNGTFFHFTFGSANLLYTNVNNSIIYLNATSYPSDYEIPYFPINYIKILCEDFDISSTADIKSETIPTFNYNMYKIISFQEVFIKNTNYMERFNPNNTQYYVFITSPGYINKIGKKIVYQSVLPQEGIPTTLGTTNQPDLIRDITYLESDQDNTILYDIYYPPYLSNIFGNKVYYASAKIGGKNVFLKLNTENNKITFFNDSSIMYQYDREEDSKNQIKSNGYYVNAICTSNLNNLYLFSCNCDS